MFEVFLVAFLSLRYVSAECSGPDPISLPITEVVLSNGGSRRGIQGSIGSPAQTFSFLPQNFLNNTWVYNTTAPFCVNGTTATQCLTQRGGEYDPSASTSSQGGLDVYAAGGDSGDTARREATHIWFNEFAKDDLTIANTTLEGFAIGMPGFDFGGLTDMQANIGLGQNSTILTSLKNSGRIQSRTYSYWWGVDSTSDNVAMDGQMVFGGYDRAKVQGPNITASILPWSLACPSGMYITVTSMGLDFPNGTTADMLSTSALGACLQLDWPFLASIRNDPYFERFQAQTDTSSFNNSLGTYWWAPMYQPGEVFPGAITVSLAQGLSFKVPNEVLVVGDQYVGPDGVVQSDSSAPLVLMAPTAGDNDGDTPIIGMQFFSAAYLMVDLDAGTFTLWQANATTDSDLVTVGGACAEKITGGSAHNTTSASTSTGGASSSQTNATNSTSITASEPADTSPGIGPGAIAGAAIGGFALLILLAVIAFFLVRRRRKTVATEDSTMVLTDLKERPNSCDKSWHDTQERYYGGYPGPHESMSQPINEMPACQTVQYELDTTQKPSELSQGATSSPVEMSGLQTPRFGKHT